MNNKLLNIIIKEYYYKVNKIYIATNIFQFINL